MSLMSGIVVYLMIWWVVIFAVLPWGIKRNIKHTQGHDTGAPEKTYLIYKLIITSVLSILIWFIVNYFIQSNIINFAE